MFHADIVDPIKNAQNVYSNLICRHREGKEMMIQYKRKSLPTGYRLHGSVGGGILRRPRSMMVDPKHKPRCGEETAVTISVRDG